MTRLGAAKEDLHRLLLEEAKSGRVSLHRASTTKFPPEVIEAGIRLEGQPEPLVTIVLKEGAMTNIFAELEVNPFEDDVVTEPRRVSFSVAGLNDKPLEQLIARFRELTEGELPRRQIPAQKAQLVVSPDRGYGKSHLLGRLFKRLGEEATLIYLRPFQDPQRIWSSILQATIQELERPSQNGQAAGS